MPQIPLYNQGRGPAVRLATGTLSPRASSQAFESVGLAQAKLGNTIQDVAKVAAEFEKARQDAENDDIAEEYSVALRDSYRELNSQPTTSLDEYRQAESTVRQGIMAGVDGMERLGSAQKRRLKDKLNKYSDLLAGEGEQATFTRFINKASETANKRAENMLDQITSGTMPLEMGLAEHDEFYDLSVSRGYSMNRSKREFRLEALRRDVNMMAQDDTLNFQALKEVDKVIMQGQGDYAGLDVSERQQLSSILNSKMQYLDNQAVVEAQTQFDDATLTATSPVTSYTSLYQAQRDAESAINTMEVLGYPEKAAAMRLDFDVAKEVAFTRDKLAFASTSQVEGFLQDLREDTVDQRGQPGSYKREKILQQTEAFLDKRKEAILKDPAAYINAFSLEKTGRAASKGEIVKTQIDMGFELVDVRPLTQTEVDATVELVNTAESTKEIARAMAIVGDKYPSQITKQLRDGGISLGHIYISNDPDSPMAKKLFASMQPEAIQIVASPTAKQRIRQQVLENEIFDNHMKSVLGGGYADYNNREIRGASSDIAANMDIRARHVEMITDLSVFLLQEENKLISGETGERASKEEIKTAVTGAVSLLDEKYDYIADKFPNKSTTLRIPSYRSSEKGDIYAGLAETVRQIKEEDVFYEDPFYEPGSPEYDMKKEDYVERVKAGYGWVATSDSSAAVLVDNSGGVVFENTPSGPLPIRVTLNKAVQVVKDFAKTREEIKNKIDELNERAQLLQRSKVGAGTLSKLKGTPQYDEQRAANDALEAETQAIYEQVNQLKRRRAQMR